MIPPGRAYHVGVDYEATVSRLRDGACLREIAREYGVSGAAISQGARRHGWTGGRPGRKPRAEQSTEAPT